MAGKLGSTKTDFLADDQNSKGAGKCSQLTVGQGTFTAGFAAWAGGDKEQGAAPGLRNSCVQAYLARK